MSIYLFTFTNITNNTGLRHNTGFSFYPFNYPIELTTAALLIYPDSVMLITTKTLHPTTPHRSPVIQGWVYYSSLV